MIAINPIQETWTDHQQTIMEKTARLLKNLGIISNTDHVSNLYGIKKSYGSFALPLPDDCPDVAYRHIQKHLDKTVPLLSKERPDMPCLIHTNKLRPDGYAHHTPPINAKGSVILSRYIFQYLNYPEGIPLHDSKGETLEVDHDCGNGKFGCIHPLHLNLLTKSLNQSLGDRRYK